MPDMDGFALADKLRRSQNCAGKMIMMLTSGGLRGDLARCRELGIAALPDEPMSHSRNCGGDLSLLVAKRKTRQ